LDGDAVTECGNQIDPQVKPTPSVAIRLLKDAEDLEPPDDVPHRRPDPGEVAVADSLVVDKRVGLAGFIRCPGMRLLMSDTLIAGIRQGPLPGNENCPFPSSASSTPTTVRNTVVSSTPQRASVAIFQCKDA
jgi:hypothetical protein